MTRAATSRLVWFVRHGHRADDGPMPSPGLGLAPLSPLGRQEAAAFAAGLERRPDLIVASSFLRAIETAAALRERHRDAPFEIWPVEEFTFLPAAAFDGTSFADRAPASAAYWERGEPDFHPGEGGESFRAFVARADDCLSRLRSRHEAFTVVFTHGFTIKLFLWRIQNPNAPLDRAAFASYRALKDAVSVPTLAVLPVDLPHEGAPAAGKLFRPALAAPIGAADARE